jgi:hypothetical protein
VTEQRNRKLRNETKEKKCAKTSTGGTDTKGTKERTKILRLNHPKEVIFLRKTKLVIIP